MKALFFNEHGGADLLQYGDIPLPELSPGWGRVRVKAVALNHLDIWIRRGWPGLKLPMPHITGADICGELESTNGEINGIHIGDRVIIFPGILDGNDEFVDRGEPSLSPHYQVLGEHRWGGLAEYVDVPLENIERAPVDNSDAACAAPNLVVTTVWRMLFARAHYRKEESVLIVGSGGGVNSLSIQICAALGSEVFVLSGNEEKATKARALGASSVILYSENTDWHREIFRQTGGCGVDLVVDNVGEATLEKSLKSLRRGGRVVTVGNTSGHKVKLDSRLIFGKQISLIGSTMGSIDDWKEGLSFLREHEIQTPLDGVYPLSEGKTQLERMERGEHFGKIILQP